jgi:hypothetical protein
MMNLDNSGRSDGPLRVPGFGGIPVDYQLPAASARFAHGVQEWRQSPMVTAQESAMVAVMERLTDKPMWWVDVFDDGIVARWRREVEEEHFVVNPRLMKGRTWDWCVRELRDKAVCYRERGHVRVLDTGSCVCKGDSDELRSLGEVLRDRVGPLAWAYRDGEERRVRREKLEKSRGDRLGQDADADLGADADAAQAEDHEVDGNGHTVDIGATTMEESEQDSHMILDTEAETASDNQQAEDHNTTEESEERTGGEENEGASHMIPEQQAVEDLEGRQVEDDHNLAANESDDDSSETRFMHEDYMEDDIPDTEDEHDDEGDREDHDIYWLWSRQQRQAHPGKALLDFAGCAHMISAFVDPLMYPLVYGRTLVLQHGGTVALKHILASYGAAQAAPRHIPDRPEPGAFSPWSRRYQSLPCEVAFVKNSHNTTDVKITSYINGLHPDYHAEMYWAIEQVLSRAIQPWNDCLVRVHAGLHDRYNLGQLGPVPARIVTYGVEWESELPEWAVAFRVPSESCKQYYHEQREKLQQLPEGSRKRKRKERELQSRFTHVIGKEDRKLPSVDSDLWRRAKEYLGRPDPDGSSTVPEDWHAGDERTWDLLCEKARRILCHKHPEPGTAFSYEEWKTGRHDSRPIVDKAVPEPGRKAPVAPPHVGYSVALQDSFRDKGLQVLVEISSIELTPEDTPAYAPDAAAQAAAYAARAAERYTEAVKNNRPVNLDRKADGDGWQRPGRLNEHIVGVAMFAFDVENVTEPRVAFRQRQSLDYTLHRFGEVYKLPKNAEVDYDPLVSGPAHLVGKETDTEALAEILGVPDLQLSRDMTGGPYPYHHMGSVAMREGRLVAFPNALEHRISPFELVDGTRNGRCRWLTLYLVDPHYRVCSTRNVPPQQHEWWAEAVGQQLRKEGRLSQEIVDQIMRETDEWPMGVEEALWHRGELVKEQNEQRQRERTRHNIGNWY